MTPEQFQQWLKEMREAGNITADRQAGPLLGVTDRTILRYKKEGTDLTVSLACKNLLHRLGPYR